MRIERIHIKGLFGMFEHDIRLNKEERITVIYGMNGIGKTMIFRILEYLFDSNFFKLSNCPFDIARIYTDNDENLTVNNKGNIEVTLRKGDKTLDSYYFHKTIQNHVPSEIFGEIERRFPIRRIGREKYINVATEEVYTPVQLLDKYQSKLPSKVFKQLNLEDGNGKIAEIISQLSIHFIETQRLIRFSEISNQSKRSYYDDEPKMEKIETVEHYSQELYNLIGNKHREYAKLSESFELSLGKRLMDKTVNTYSNKEELNHESRQLDKKREALKAVGLFDDDKDELFIIPDEIDELGLAVLSVNVQDMKNKLKIFDDIYYKLSLFLEIINKRRFSYKIVSIHPEQGFIFKNIKDKELKSTELSSGEQHELVLIYELLFKVPENSLVLIDEPEISLHVAWQKDFLNDLKEIIAIRKFDVMVSTHSPSIINGEWDLTIGLGKDKEEYA
jgi:predicted ATPase